MAKLSKAPDGLLRAATTSTARNSKSTALAKRATRARAPRIEPDEIEEVEEPEEEEEEEEPKYIRVGTRSKNSVASRSQDQLAMEAVIVAQKNGHNNGIKFYEIESWYLFNISIGHCELGDPLTDIDDMLGEAEWQPDNLFAGMKTLRDLRARVLAVMDSEVVSMHEYKQDPDLSEHEAQDLVKGKLIRPPIHPSFSEDTAPRHDKAVNGEDDIHAVVFFLNNALNKSDLTKAGLSDLKLPLNLQVTLNHDDTFDTFSEYLLEGDHHYRGLSYYLENETDRGGLPFWLRPKLWIVPQSTDPDQELIAYSWKNETNRQAHEFLHPNADAGDRRLYFEVVLGVDERHEANNKAWFARLKNAGIAPEEGHATPRRQTTSGPAPTTAKARPSGVTKDRRGTTKSRGVATKKTAAPARPAPTDHMASRKSAPGGPMTGSQTARKSAPGGPNRRR